MKKALCAVAAAALLTGALLCGCAQPVAAGSADAADAPAQEDRPVLVGNIPVAFPLVLAPRTLNIMATGYGGLEQENVFVWKKYEEMTGVDVNWTTVTREGRAEAVHTALVNGKNVDLILRCKLSATRLTQYGESGLILDLAKDDLLKENAPNCWAYLQAHPDTLASVMNPDGAIYSLPQVNSGAELRVGLKIFINKTWLDRVGMELPKTTEEFRVLLTAFRERDPNGNGDPTDEIPLCGANWQSVAQSLYGAFGLGNRGFHNEIVDADPETGAVRLMAASDAYRAFLTYMRELYAEGLLDNYVFTITDEQWANAAAHDRIGVFASTNLAGLPADKTGN